jgi:hypothetical protein
MNAPRMTYRLLALLPALAALAASPSCQPAFTTPIAGRSLSIQITDATLLGSDAKPLAISLGTPLEFPVTVQALDENGNPDPTFNGYVRFSLSPGSVVAANGANTTGRNVQLTGGVAPAAGQSLTISVLGAFGDTAIWVEDLGYTPADPARVPPPECANGKDDNNNGLIDYPVDPGCYAANDDTEDGGSYAGAVSQTIHFLDPRIADVRGYQNGGVATAFPNEQVQVNTLWNGTSATTPKGVVVVGIGAAGFFVTDIGETRGYNSVYAYNYTAPALMYVCDRLIDFGGTSADFYGFTEMNYPTWSLDEWDPTIRPCLVPEPITLDPSTISGSTGTMATLEAGLVQVPQVGCGGLAQCCGGGCSALHTCCATLPPSEQAACTAVVDGQDFEACTGAVVSYAATDCQGLAACCASLPAAEQAACNTVVSGADDTTCGTSLKNYVNLGTCGQCPANNSANFAPSEAAADIHTCATVVAGDDPATCQSTLKTFQAGSVPVCASSSVHVSQNFGPNLVPYTTVNGVVTVATTAIGPDTTNCDYLGTGVIDFSDPREAACEAACTANLECTEYANFIAEQQFTLVVENPASNPPLKQNIFGNGSASAGFDPITMKGQQLGAFTGNLMFFSGGAQYTITARCADDVVTDPSKLPLPSSQACVVSRAIPDNNTSN